MPDLAWKAVSGMGVYGFHPTQYGHLSDEQLYAMYRQHSYQALTEMEKLALMQETVNRDAAALGERGSPEVRYADLEDGVYGTSGNGVIQIDRDLALRGIERAESQEYTVERQRQDYNIQVLNTLIHENTHSFQDQIIDGTIAISDPELTAQYRANDTECALVDLNGGVSVGYRYISSHAKPDDGYLYYFQPTERDAHYRAEERTEEILQGMIRNGGNEPSFDAYHRDVQVNGYEAVRAEAESRFQDPNFVSHVAHSLENQHDGGTRPVPPHVDQAVREAMVNTLLEKMNQTNTARMAPEMPTQLHQNHDLKNTAGLENDAGLKDGLDEDGLDEDGLEM